MEPPTAPAPPLAVKEKLRAAAIRLFARQGYANTSVQEICTEAQVSKGAFYHHYASKDALLYGIYQPLLQLQTEHLANIAGQPLPVMQRLEAAAVDVLLTSLDRLDDLTVFLQSMHLLARDTWNQVSVARQEYHQMFLALVYEGQQAGALRQDLNAELLARHFFGAVHYLTTWYRQGGQWSAELITRGYVDLWLNGVRVV